MFRYFNGDLEKHFVVAYRGATITDEARAAMSAEFAGIIAELAGSRTSERQGRLIDSDEAGSMEKKKKEGYF